MVYDSTTAAPLVKCLVEMENMIVFDGSEETIYNVTYPLYAIYMKMFGGTVGNCPCGHFIFSCHFCHPKEE